MSEAGLKAAVTKLMHETIEACYEPDADIHTIVERALADLRELRKKYEVMK